MGHCRVLNRLHCSIAFLHHAPSLPKSANLVVLEHFHHPVVPWIPVCGLNASLTSYYILGAFGQFYLQRYRPQYFVSETTSYLRH
jgi:hypothetical protein